MTPREAEAVLRDGDPETAEYQAAWVVRQKHLLISARDTAWVLGHRLVEEWHREDGGDVATHCWRCMALAEVREDGTFYGPPLTDHCTGVVGGYARATQEGAH